MVELRDITVDNYEECISLYVTEEQEKYIASNEYSIKEGNSLPDIARKFAIYVDEVMVGFTMFAFDESINEYWLWRFMIDKNLQSKGYGYKALKVIIYYFKREGIKEIILSTKEENFAAIELYKKFGFITNGEFNDDEAILKLKL